MKLRRATRTDPPVDEDEDTDDPPGLFDNPFRIRAEEDRVEPAGAEGRPMRSGRRVGPSI